MLLLHWRVAPSTTLSSSDLQFCSWLCLTKPAIILLTFSCSVPHCPRFFYFYWTITKNTPKRMYTSECSKSLLNPSVCTLPLSFVFELSLFFIVRIRLTHLLLNKIYVLLLLFLLRAVMCSCHLPLTLCCVCPLCSYVYLYCAVSVIGLVAVDSAHK
jgi:hypothetical protein